MSMIMPFLRMTQSELQNVRQELQPVLERWVKDWCVMAPKVEIQATPIDNHPMENLWGSGAFWLSANQQEQWNSLLYLALFEKNKSDMPLNPAALNVIKKAQQSLFGDLLNLPEASPLSTEPTALKGSSVVVELSIPNHRASVLLSPSVVMDILDGKCYLPVDNNWQPLVKVLKDVEHSFEAVIGNSELPIQAFLDLNVGDVITLDLTSDAKLNGAHGPIATVIPCSSDQQSAVLIIAFTK